MPIIGLTDERRARIEQLLQDSSDARLLDMQSALREVLSAHDALRRALMLAWRERFSLDAGRRQQRSCRFCGSDALTPTSYICDWCDQQQEQDNDA